MATLAGGPAVRPASPAPVAAAGDALIDRELRLVGSWWARAGLAALLAAIVVLPLSTSNTFLLSVLNTAGITAVGAIGLNVLMGYAGQLSIGHGFFLAVGGYAALLLGGRAGAPLPVWLLGAALAGGLVGLAVGPFALRLRGIYLIVLTLGLIYIGIWAFTTWRWLSGGPSGTPAPLELALGPVDFAALRLGGLQYRPEQGLFILVWGVVAVCALLVRNLVRSRAGRAMQAIRDAELPAEMVGVSPLRTKLAAFAVASALGGVAGALTVAQLQYVAPEQFGLVMSIQFLVVLIVGGAGTTSGPIIGALVVTSIPQVTTYYAGSLPLVTDDLDTGGGFGITAGNFSLVCYGLLLVGFVLAEPRGLAHLGTRAGRAVARLVRPALVGWLAPGGGAGRGAGSGSGQ